MNRLLLTHQYVQITHHKTLKKGKLGTKMIHLYSLIYTKFYTITFKVRIVVIFSGTFLVAQNVKHLSTMQETCLTVRKLP